MAKLKIYYYIGFSKGRMSKTVYVSEDNPFTDVFVETFSKLQPAKGYPQLALSYEAYNDSYKNGYITEFQRDLFMVLQYLGEEEIDNFLEKYGYLDQEPSKEKLIEYVREFEGCLVDQSEDGTFLVFKNYLLKK